MTAAPAGRAYSVAIRTVKIVLPLLALGILSLLVLLARQAPRGEPLRIVDGGVAALAEREQVGTPRHSGISADGTDFTLTANQAWSDETVETVTRGVGLRGVFGAQDGYIYDVTADEGRSDAERRMSFLEGDVVIKASNGYTLRTDAMRIRNDYTYLTSLAPVHAEGPRGTIDAGRMEIFLQPGDNTRTRIVFREGVRVFHVSPSMVAE